MMALSPVKLWASLNMLLEIGNALIPAFILQNKAYFVNKTKQPLNLLAM